MAAHTPGPWYTFTNAEGVLQVWAESRHINEDVLVATAEDDGGVLGADEDNARLIAAAPDLLEAAKAALVRLDAIDISTINRDLRAAIAKAEGAS